MANDLPQPAPRVMHHLSRVRFDLIVVCLLIAATWVLYVPSLKYPFVWYDADDLLRAIKYSPLNLFAGVASYQYYRPLIFMFWKVILGTWGPDSAPIFHAYLIGAHLLNAVLLYALACALTRKRSIAVATALLFTVYPFSYQAVTWTIAHQSPSLILVLACLLIYTRARLQRRGTKDEGPKTKAVRSLFVIGHSSSVIRHFFAILCLIAAMLLHESAFVGAGILLLVEAYLVLTRRVPRPSLWPLAYLAITAAMFVIYSSAAKSSPTQATFQPITGFYLLQGLVYPIAMIVARMCQPTTCDSVMWLLPASVVTLIILLLIWRAKRTTPIGLLGVLWFGLSIAPMWASRDFLYNEYAPRLLYLAGAGASLAIAAIMGPVRESASQGVSIHSAVGVGAIALIVLQSGQFVIARQVLHEDAFRLLDQENRAMFMLRRGSVLFINTVELFTFRESEFPLGWFGVLASPWHNRIVTDKNLRAQNADWVIDPVQAQQVQDRSRLALEFHGRVLAPDQLRAAVVAASEVYRVEAVTPSRPNPSPSEAGPTGEGDLHLFKIAAIEHTVEPAVSFMAEWAAPIRLITASVDIEAGTLVLNLDWSIGGPLGAGQTVFVHVRNAAGAIVAQADGDSVGGLAPLSSWTAGDRVQERRPLILPSDLPAGTYTIALGLYDRASLQRAIPTRTSGIVITDGALIVATFNYP